MAELDNSGDGGPDRISRHPKTTPDAFDETMAKVHAHFAALPVSKGLQPDLELWTGEQLNTFVAAAQFKRALKKIVTVEDGCLYTYRTPQQQDRIDAIIANFQAKGKTVLNRVPFDEALKLFRATAAEE